MTSDEHAGRHTHTTGFAVELEVECTGDPDALVKALKLAAESATKVFGESLLRSGIRLADPDQQHKLRPDLN